MIDNEWTWLSLLLENEFKAFNNIHKTVQINDLLQQSSHE